ncbi:CBS domain-containing protein [Roseomonas sp. SSH11]|uniref:CBS domain-containing protein n=1 Tax=Pararoseomonas baculiformis TaxID=2820812 RepID=A0ABS4ADX4_9PROT|nr:CBS domain-containing protein [Pararoseomonas baculiformis]MBP0445217.1 CBS domain-containing protein [Pararoseomonas baculiformis]
MTVASILRSKGREVVNVKPGEKLGEVARTLVRHRIGAALVCEGDAPPVGIISERDIVRVFAEEEGMTETLTAADAMTRILYTVTPETTIEQALEMMTDRRVRHLPVLEGGKLHGIISIGDLVKARIEAAVGEAAALRDYVATG